MKIFLLQRPQDNILLISHRTRKQLHERLQEGEIEGFFGSYPEESQRDALKRQLYFIADQTAEKEFQEGDYLWRSICTFFCFLILFFLMSYVVRDPIPLIDEIALSLAGSLLFNLWFRKKRARGQRLEMMKLEMRSNVDSVAFSEQETVRNMELYLQSLDVMIQDNKLDFQSLPVPVFMNKGDKILRELFLAMDSFWSAQELRKEIRRLKADPGSSFKDLSMLIAYLKLRTVYSTR